MKKYFIIGFFSAITLLVFYFSILSLANSLSHAFSQFRQIWYWTLVLATGFGTQVGLYFFIRESQKKISLKPAVASGTVSAGSMVACCLHHLADVLPLMGLAGAALFLIQYQIFFLFLGVLSNIVGIVLMLEVIQKNQFTIPAERDELKRRTQFSSLFEKISVYDLGKIKKAVIVISLILLPAVFFITGNQNKPGFSQDNNAAQEKDLSTKIILPGQTNNQNGITFEAVPLDFNFDNPIQFKITITTHSGSLDFDPAKISALEDGNGNKFAATEWQGSPAGGHHRSGVLIFPRLNAPAKNLKLVINDGYQRIFKWDLQ